MLLRHLHRVHHRAHYPFRILHIGRHGARQQGVDFAVALGDLGPPPGADVVLMLDLHVDLAGTLLTLGDIPVPLRIP